MHTFEAEGMWQAIGNLMKLTYLFDLEYNLWAAAFWDMMGRLFFHLPPSTTHLDVRNAVKEIGKARVMKTPAVPAGDIQSSQESNLDSS